MKRIAIIGSSCSGKSTLAGTLSTRLGYPHIELDALHWLPDWTEKDGASFRAEVDQATHAECWITDGNYTGKLGTLLFDKADTVVWLNLPFWTVYRRLWVRQFRRIVSRETLWNDNRETLREAFFQKDSLVYFIPRTWRKRNRRIRRWFETAPEDTTCIELTSPRDVSAWLADLPQA